VIASQFNGCNISSDDRERFAIGSHSSFGQIVDGQLDDSHNISGVLIKCAAFRLSHDFVPFKRALRLVSGKLFLDFVVAQNLTAPSDSINKVGGIRELYCAILSSCVAIALCAVTLLAVARVWPQFCAVAHSVKKNGSARMRKAPASLW
jgi:hypothetical protein